MIKILKFSNFRIENVIGLKDDNTQLDNQNYCENGL